MVEGARLESVYTRKGIKSSNLLLSAFARRSFSAGGFRPYFDPYYGGLPITPLYFLGLLHIFIQTQPHAIRLYSAMQRRLYLYRLYNK